MSEPLVIETSPRPLLRAPSKAGEPLTTPRIAFKPPAVNSLDHSIYRENGSTMALEYTASRLRAAKLEPVSDLRTRVEELTREMGYLRQEIHFYRQCFEILQRLRQTTYGVYQQLLLASYFPPSSERLQELVIQLHHALEDSVQREVKAEGQWKAFWGVKTKEGLAYGGMI